MRIIAGSARGTKLQDPGETTRPTSDRVREAIFNVLRHVIPEARVLDLFAGTGALGLEALSRGSASCTFVENDPQALRRLRNNIARTKFPQTRVLETDALLFITSPRPSAEFDLIFADPPYHRPGLPDFATPLLEEPLPLAPEGIFVLEVESERPTPETPHLTFLKRKDYGNTSVLYFQKPDPGAA